jgi:Beta-lactamase enzyme family
MADRRNRRKRSLFVAVGFIVLGAVLAGVLLVLRSHISSTEDVADSPTPRSTTSESSPTRLPTAAQFEAAERFAKKRAGRVSFAVIDTSGALACHRCRLSYHSASVVKAMLLVSYLDHLAEVGEPLSADHEAYLASMIRVSDNDAATAIYSHVGDKGLSKLAAEAGMTDFQVSGSWGSAHITAADQARFFAALDELIVPEYRDYALALLSSISTEQSWGIPDVARPEWQTFFKGGWLLHEDGRLVHQVARLEKDGSSLAIAVLTDGDPSDAYGRETIQGIAAHLLGD